MAVGIVVGAVIMLVGIVLGYSLAFTKGEQGPPGPKGDRGDLFDKKI